MNRFIINFIIKGFGINKFSFWTWLTVGMLLNLLVVATILLWAYIGENIFSSDRQEIILIMILLVLLCQFLLHLQNYLSKYVEKIEREQTTSGEE